MEAGNPVWRLLRLSRGQEVRVQFRWVSVKLNTIYFFEKYYKGKNYLFRKMRKEIAFVPLKIFQKRGFIFTATISNFKSENKRGSLMR